MGLFWLFFAILTGLFVSQCYGFLTNYHNARKTGLPIVFAPIDPEGALWQILGPLSRSLWMRLPEALTLWIRLIDLTEIFRANDDLQHRLGSTLIVVSPIRNTILASDPETINAVLMKRKDYIKPRVYDTLNLFGRNVDTVNGEEWNRHRKLTAPCFNERVSGFVWDESRRQAKAMLDSWLKSHHGIANTMVEDTRILALHVLSAAGFGITQEFNAGSRKPSQGHTMSHRDSLMLVLYNLIIVLAFPWTLMNLPFMPKKVQRVGTAVKEFDQYMDEMLAHEREAMRKEQGLSKPNLISTLIRVSDGAKDSSSPVRLTDTEIKGNIFIFNLAGHDTTANTLAYAFSLLAINPQYQDWLVEELDQVIGDKANPEYEKTHPKLKRCMAIMYETLRLYGPVVMIPRGVTNLNEALPIGSSNTIMPPNTDIRLNLQALHTDRNQWGPDPSAFRPTRWIKPSNSLQEGEELVIYEPSLYAPWSLGPRICPGMKFAQVEFTAALSTVFGRCRVLPTRKDGVASREDRESARRELKSVVRDSGFDAVTLTMKRPGDVWLEILEK